MHSTTHFHAQQTHQFIVVATFNRRQRCPPTRGFSPSSSSSSSRGRENDYKRTTRKNSNRGRFGKRSSSFASSSSSRNDDELGAFLCRSSTSDDDVNIKNNNDDAVSVSLPLNELKPGEKQSRASNIHRRSEFVQISSNKAKTINPPENLSKLQLFGRKYWPLLATLELLALIGATASGIRARQQKIIVDELNEKLRAINQSLTARSKRNPTGMGASLGYVGAQMAGTPVDSPMSASMSELASGIKDEAAIKNDGDDASKGGKKTDFAVGPEDSMDDSEYDETRVNLKKGRQLLREKSYQEAISSFEKALALSRMNGDQIKMRRAVRGLGATKKAMGELSDAIKYMEEVLDISKAIKDYTGDMDAVGSIADMYTELGDLEKAGEYYDMYLSKINDASVDYDD